MTTATNAPTRWTIDTSHSSVGFSVRHMMITNVRGEFKKFAGEVVLDPQDPSVNATVEIGSIHTREEQRDAHLRSADFFDAEKYPTMTFTSKRVARTGDGYDVVGDLTIRDQTREVVLKVEDVTGETADPWGNTRIGASAKTKIRRSEFGITWNALLELGGAMVGDEVTINIEVSLVKQK
ncbi:YceI family protein [Nannocystis punicea]|uniref:YceI family protein n=1 Tax=Nannocystis punicea TaxID=2995304 RepID=A0ABY7H4Q5_9BACT|nr:YceI family protein [Nannocystis poenicansa]WAS94143.1 YceI family protein [Nannocystis poenicansa]